jgi:hypothetical protein
MWILVNVAMLVIATVIAGAAAVAVCWLLLRATVGLMRPAALGAPRRGNPVTRNPSSFGAITASVSFKEGSK